jgi:hypothetical protein
MQSDGGLGPNGIGLRGFLWRLAKTTVWVAGVLALMTLIPLDVPFVPVFPIIVMTIVVLAVLGLLVHLYRQGRRQTILHFVLALVILSALQFAAMAWDAQRVAALERRQILVPSQAHRLVVFDWTRQSCFDQCIELLAKTDYQPAGNLPETTEWAVFEAARGEACSAAGSRKSRLEFLEAGFSDLCAVRKIRPAGDGALIIRSHYASGWFGSRGAMPSHIPRSFSGWVYEIYERSNGEQRTLGRWLNGRIRPLSYWFGVVGLDGWKVGERFEPAQFYSAALKAPIVGGRFPGDSALPPLFAQLEPYLSDPRFERKTRRAFGALAVMNNKGDLATVKRSAAAMLANAKPSHILTGLELLAALPRSDLGRFEAPLLALLHHENNEVVMMAMTIARKLPGKSALAALPDLVARAKRVPIKQLDDYVYMLRGQVGLEAHSETLTEILKVRITEARSGSPSEQRDVRKLERLLNDL